MRTAADNARRNYERIRQRQGVAVTYTRGVTTLSLTVVVGRTAFASNSPNRVRLEWGDRDYLILVDELVTLGEPAEGDRITETINGSPVTFEAMAPAGEPAQRFSDPSRIVFRVHCKEKPTA